MGQSKVSPYSTSKFADEIWRSRLLRLLRLISDGYNPAKIALFWPKPPNQVHYHLKKLEKARWIEREAPVRGSSYRLLQPATNFIVTYENRTGFGHRVRLEHWAWKYPVVKEPEVPVEWDKVNGRMKNWAPCYKSVCGLTVERTPKHLIIHAEVLEGENPYELAVYARDECERLASKLEGEWRMQLGRPVPCGKPEFATPDDPVSVFVRKNNGKVRVPGVGQVDGSHGPEIDWASASAAAAYLMMPERVEKIDDKVSELTERIGHRNQEVASLRAEVGELKAVVPELTSTLKQFVSTLNELNGSGKAAQRPLSAAEERRYS